MVLPWRDNVSVHIGIHILIAACDRKSFEPQNSNELGRGSPLRNKKFTREERGFLFLWGILVTKGL